MSSLGKRTYGANLQIAKRARTSAGRQMATFRRSAAMSARYNSRMSSRMQRAPGVSRETGFVDVASAVYALDTTGSVTLLNTIAQGASVNQRVGKKVVMRSLQCRGYCQNSSTASANDVAFVIVYDKRPTGALPAVTDIFTAASSSAMTNDANSGRFTILKRWNEVLIGNLTAAANYTEAAYKNVDYFLPLKNLPVAYKAAGTGAIGDIEQGALYLVTLGSSAASTGAASLVSQFRLRFLDV